MLVTGSNGQVGQELQNLAVDFPLFRFTWTGKEELDITDGAAVNAFFSQNNFAFCLNCAAYTAVDQAESDAVRAEKVNVDGVRNLALACSTGDVRLLHLSTDYVYHTGQNLPFLESDPVQPQGVYAKTKLAGERAALEVHPLKTAVIRTSWLYSSQGHNFVKTMLRLGATRPEVNVLFDQIGTPTYARDLAHAMLSMIQQVENQEVAGDRLCGIYHYSNEGVASWYDFAVAIFDLAHMEVKVNPIETSAYPTPAKRPPFSVLNKRKFKSAFGLKIPHWRTSLQTCLQRL